jgi:hypothetical protein
LKLVPSLGESTSLDFFLE